MQECCTCVHWTGHIWESFLLLWVELAITAFCVNGLHQKQLFIRTITHEWHHLSTGSTISSIKRLWILISVINHTDISIVAICFYTALWRWSLAVCAQAHALRFGKIIHCLQWVLWGKQAYQLSSCHGTHTLGCMLHQILNKLLRVPLVPARSYTFVMNMPSSISQETLGRHDEHQVCCVDKDAADMTWLSGKHLAYQATI